MPQIRQTKANSLPLFAQPIEERTSGAVHPTKSPVLRAAALLALVGTVGGCLFLLPKADHAQNLTTPLSVSHQGPTVDPAGAAAVSHRRSMDFYVHGVRDTMFSPPAPPAPPAPKVSPIRVIKPIAMVKPVPKPVLPVVEVNPFADWAYKGTVHLGTDTMALLENTKTNEGQYVRVGDSFIGAQVSAITDQQITMASAGKPMLLAKSDAMNVTPLDKSADFLKGGQQNPGGPPNPNGQPTPAPAAPPASAPGSFPPNWKVNADGTVTLPNGRTMPAARAQRRAQFMNNRFNN